MKKFVIVRCLPLLVLTLSIESVSAFYDASIQRWINRDPIQESGGINLYAFTENEPTNEVDGFGLTKFWRNCDSFEWTACRQQCEGREPTSCTITTEWRDEPPYDIIRKWMTCWCPCYRGMK